MDGTSSNPHGRDLSADLTIDAPSTPDLRSNLHPPPSPASMASCSSADAVAGMSPAARATLHHPAVSPAWEVKESHQHESLHEEVHDSAAGIVHSPAVALTITAPNISTLDPSTPVHAAAAGPLRFSSANLRPDLIPPVAGGATAAAAASAAATAGARAAGAAPSPPGIVDTNTASDETAVAQGFFGSSTDTSSHSDAGGVGAAGIPAAARHEDAFLSRAVSDATSSSTMRPPSSRSGMSGIFELELDSPLPPAAATTAAVGEEVDLSSGDVEDKDLHGSTAVSSDSPVAEAASAEGSSSGAAFSRVAPLPWGRIAPSPDSSPSLRGSWGQLQEVMDEIKVISPSSPTSYVPPPFLHGARPSATPLAEERKEFARAAVAANTTTQGHPVRSSHGSLFPSAITDRRQPPPPPQQQQQSYRSPSPSSPRLATSPPTPAASAGNTPRDEPPTSATPAAAAAAAGAIGAAVAVQRGSSRSPLSRRLYAASRQQPPGTLSREAQMSGVGGGAVAAAAAGAEDAATASPSMLERQAGLQPVLPRPGGALGASSPISFASPAGVAAETAAAARDEAGESRLGTGTYESDDDAQTKLEDVRGDNAAGKLLSVTAAVSAEDTMSGRGFVGKKFVQAAEALSESPHLRRAAGAAATAVSAAADSARVQFTYTSRKIGKMLEASAKSFEQFVDEQLKEDGSGQVLRREGGTGLLVPRGKMLSQAFIVAPGCYLCWEFRVKEHDLGFALRRRSQGLGGSFEEDIFELKRYKSGKTFQGRWTADGDTSAVVIMVWDNSYSCLRPKTLAYKVQVNRPGADPTAPPPPPPPTPADVGTPQLPGLRDDTFDGGGVVGGARDTEAFPIDESEGEDSSAYPVPGDGDGRDDDDGEEGKGDVASSSGVTVGLRRMGYIGPARDERGREGEERPSGGKERGRGRVPVTIRIEDFLAKPEIGSDVSGGSDRGGGAEV